MPDAPYLLLVQNPHEPARVIYYRMSGSRYSSAAGEILFSGGRVAAKKFLQAKAIEVGWEKVPQYNQPKSRRGRVPPLRKIEWLGLADWKAGKL